MVIVETLKSWLALDTTSRAWHTRAQAAKSNTPNEGIGKIVVQLRQRGRAANFRANWMMAAVIAVVLFGLGYYIGRPIIQDLSDGRATTWQERKDTAESDGKVLETRRAQQIATLKTALSLTAREVRPASGERLSPLLLPGTTTLIATGENGTILRSTNSGEKWDEVYPNSGETLLTPLLLPGTGTLIATGRNGTILRSTNSGEKWDEVHPASGEPLDPPLLLPGTTTLIATGTNGTILRSTNSGEKWDEVRPASGDGLDTPLLLPGTTTLIATGWNGTILRSTNSGEKWDEVRPASGEGLDTPLLLPGTTTLIATGWNDTILRSTNSGEKWDEVRPASGEKGLDTPLLLPGTGTLIATGGKGTILRSTNSGEKWDEVRPASGEGLDTPLLLPGTGTLIATGENGTILRSTNSGEKWDEVRPASGEGLDTPLLLPGTTTLIATGWNGTILRSTNSGEKWDEVRPASGEGLDTPLLLPGTTTLIATGWNGTILQISDWLANQLDALEIPPFAAGDARLKSFIDEHWQTIEPVEAAAPIVEALSRIRIEREQVDADLLEAETELTDLTSGVVTLKDRQAAFEAFMQGCRAGQTEDDNGVVTQACVAAYKSGEAAEAREWWTVLAEQVPQGILLLFLLATLSGLYRYNVRLAGFHHSRADALELLLQNVSIKDLTQIADALAADKVEFGAAKTPTDHAAEMATALINRAKP